MTVSVSLTPLAGEYLLGKPIIPCTPAGYVTLPWNDLLPWATEWATWFNSPAIDGTSFVINLDCAQEIITDVLWQDGLPLALADRVDCGYASEVADPVIAFRGTATCTVTGNSAYLSQTPFGVLATPAPGLHIRPIVAATAGSSVTGTNAGRIQLKEHGLPINIELYFTCNDDRSGLYEWPGYTHFFNNYLFRGTLHVTPIGTVPASEHVRRYVTGAIKQTASAATCVIADIMCGILYEGDYTGGTLYMVVNGVVQQTHVISGPVIKLSPAIYMGYYNVLASELFDKGCSWESIACSANDVVLTAATPGADKGFDTFLIKWVNYLDRDTGLGAGVDAGQTTLLTWPAMYSHPGMLVV